MEIDWLDRFWSKVCPEPNTGCWLWTASCDRKGYGQYKLDSGRPRRSHRVAYEKTIGPIPVGLSVLHRCDTPSCVNPDHLFVGTAMENTRDMQAKGRAPVGEKSGSAKLTNADAQEIRELYASGKLQREIAVLWGVDQSTISYLCAKKTWRHLLPQGSGQ